MKTTNDFSGANLNAIRTYIQELEGEIFLKQNLTPLFEAMEGGTTATTLEQDLNIVDFLIVKGERIFQNNPKSVLRYATPETIGAIKIVGIVRNPNERLGNPQMCNDVFTKWKDWMESEKRYLQTIPPKVAKPETEPNAFEHIVKIGEAEPSQLFERLQTLIEEHQNEKTYIGAMFFKCLALGYIRRNPTKAEIKRWFGDGVEVDSNYMPNDVTNKWKMAINKAENIEIFGGDEKKKWVYWRNYNENKRKSKRK